MTLQAGRLALAVTFLVFYSLLGGCFAQSEENRSVRSNPTTSAVVASPADRTEILRTVRRAYETPTQKYLCSSDTPAARNKVRSRFTEVFTEEILNEYFSAMALCDVLASARFGSILDTPEAIEQTYTLKFADPYSLQGATVVEVRFRPLFKGKQGEEGGAIVYLKKLTGGWRIANIESIDHLGANGFRSLIQSYPTVSSEDWADMDYTKSLTRPSKRR